MEMDKRGDRMLFASNAEDLSLLFRQLFESMQEGFAIHEIICDEAGNSVDYRFIDVNPAFEELTGIKRELIVGKTVKAVMPTTEAYWIQRYGKVALTGVPARFEAFAEAIGRHYSVYTYSPGPKLFATLFADVTDRVRAVESLRIANESLEEKVRLRTVQLDAANQELTAHNEEVRAVNEELTAQNEEINALNEEIASINAVLAAMNEELEQRVDERTQELKRTLEVQHVLRGIAEAALLSATMQELYEQVHRLLDRVLPNKLFHINLLDESTQEIIVPYKAEEVNFLSSRRPLGKGITEYIMGLGRTTYLKPDELDQLFESGKCTLQKLHNVPIRHYLGAPLHDSKGNAMGTLGLILMGNDQAFLEEDSDFLTIIAAQIAMAMERKRAERTLIDQETSRAREIEKDAQTATRVQKALLPEIAPSNFLQVAAVFQHVGYVGGDLFFMDWRYEGSLLRGFLIDAAGDGLGTALHTAALHELLREVNELDLPLPDAMRWLNRRAFEYFGEEEIDGAFAFELDLHVRQLRWVCGGNPLLWIATPSFSGRVPCPDLCLGMTADATFELHTIPIGIGDSFVFMTDGLDRLFKESAEELHGGHAQRIRYIRKLVLAEELQDDATAICLEVTAFPQSAGSTDGWPRIFRLNGYGDYQRLKGELAKVLAEVTGKPHSMQEVAVNEAIANALECRDGKARQQQAFVKVNRFGNCLVVRVKTSRIGFAGNAMLRRFRANSDELFSFGEDASMGRGIPMMLSIADKMTYNSEGTEVLLSWKLSGGRGCD